MMKRIRHLSIAAVALFGVGTALAQEGGQLRSITSDDFVSQRPAPAAGAATGGKRSAPPKSAVYKFKRASARVVRRKPDAATRPKPSDAPTATRDVGVTMWRLRPPLAGEAGYLFPVQTPGGRQSWVGERVDADDDLRTGDRIRLAIESPAAGYLYVIDSEMYGDGSFGDPYLIFPEKPSDDNAVRPGLLTDLPDRAESLPYFLISARKDNYAGEILTIIISPKKLNSIRTEKDGRITNVDELAAMEYESNAEIFARSDLADRIFSANEANASCGAKTRGLVREEPAQQTCGDAKQLSRTDALPGAIYRVRTRSGEPVVAFVRLVVR